MEVLLNSESKPDLNLTDNRGCGPISNAVMRGDMGLIELLLQRGASIDTRYRDGRGLVQLAVGKGRYKVVDFLIKSGADFETGEQDNDALMYRRPPLVVAAHEGFLECVRVLLHHKADPNVECASGTALFNAVCENHLDVARLLLDHVPKPDMDVIPEGKPTLLICAISTSNTQLASLLIEHGAKLDFIEENTDGICKTPLSRACFEGNLQMVKLLLENKADVNYTGDVSAPPLFGALYGNRTEVAKYLLNNGADPMWTGFGGMGSLHAGHKDPGMIAELLKRAVPIDSHSIFGTALHMAAGNGKSSESVKVLLESDPKPNLEFALGDHGKIRKEIGCTPLQLACMYKAIKCVKLLLEAGANPNFRNKNGQNAVDILLDEAGDSGGADEILKLLLSKRYKAAVDQVDKRGQTWLHKIRWRTVPSTVRIMVEANTPLNVQDEQGHTPLAMAVWARNDGVAKYLIEQGAEVNVFGPGFGSILHIAVRMGYLSLVKLLVESGADLESVHREYGESLLYTAVGVRSSWRAEDLVRYLVDEAKVPIEKLGGEFGYPIIRAAHMAFADPTKVGILKFLIRRKAPLNSVDSQQRRAVHLACRSYSDEAIGALVEAGAKINVKDSFGRMPIHFAASAPGSSSTRYLLEKFQMDVNVLDHDNWTPLMWAARSGSENTIKQLIERNADVWVRSRTPGKQDEWSALKLANFAGRPESLKPRLEPKEHTMVNSNGQEEKWDEFFHKSKCGHEKTDFCSSCLVGIIGIQWKCLECTRDFSLCNKCCDISSDMHDRSHYLEAVEPMYDEDYKPSTGSSPIDSEFDLDSFDLDEED
ncbi:putative ankyrin repeat protein [Ilyonectria robusta]